MQRRDVRAWAGRVVILRRTRVQHIGTLAVVALLSTLSATPGQAQPNERGMGGVVGITVYQDREYRGRNANFRSDVADLRDSGMNDRIVSFQIAPGETWEVCEHAFYAGRCQVFFGYEPDLRQRGWSRMISSMRRVRGSGGGPGWGGGNGGGSGGSNQRGLTLHSGRNFGGEMRVITGPANDLRQLGFNDKAESLRVPRGDVWEICEDINFVRCRQVNTDWADLDGMRMRRKISSVRPWRNGGGGDWGGGRPQPQPPIGGIGRSRIVLYSGLDFRGRSYTLDNAQSSIAMSTVQSVQVYGNGSWQICEDTNFKGRCTTASGSINDIRSMGLPGRVRSARPAPRPY
jgi:hypothetical protein